MVVADEVLHGANEDKKSLQCYKQCLMLDAPNQRCRGVLGDCANSANLIKGQAFFQGLNSIFDFAIHFDPHNLKLVLQKALEAPHVM